MYVTKRARFSSAHTLYDPRLTEEENRALFGRCANPAGHGHNYLLEVTVTGEIDPKTGFVMDFGALGKLLESEVVETLDHRNISTEIEQFRDRLATCENIAAWIWNKLSKTLTGAKLHRIRLYETEDSYVEYFGEGRRSI